jgi:hypothetical protein
MNIKEIDGKPGEKAIVQMPLTNNGLIASLYFTII